MITHFKGFVYGVDASAMFAQAMSLLQKGLIGGWCLSRVVGIVNLATNIKDGGPGVRNAILEIVGWSYGRGCWSLCNPDFNLGG